MTTVGQLRVATHLDLAQAIGTADFGEAERLEVVLGDDVGPLDPRLGACGQLAGRSSLGCFALPAKTVGFASAPVRIHHGRGGDPLPLCSDPGLPQNGLGSPLFLFRRPCRCPVEPVVGSGRLEQMFAPVEAITKTSAWPGVDGEM